MEEDNITFAVLINFSGFCAANYERPVLNIQKRLFTKEASVLLQHTQFLAFVAQQLGDGRGSIFSHNNTFAVYKDLGLAVSVHGFDFGFITVGRDRADVQGGLENSDRAISQLDFFVDRTCRRQLAAIRSRCPRRSCGKKKCKNDQFFMDLLPVIKFVDLNSELRAGGGEALAEGAGSVPCLRIRN